MADQERLDAAFELAKRLSRLRFGYGTSGQTAVKQQIKRLQTFLIEEGDLQVLYAFAKYVRGADIRAIGQVFLQSEDPMMVWAFARDFVLVGEVGPYQDIVIKSRDLQFILAFAKEVKGANIPLLQETLIKEVKRRVSESPVIFDWLHRFALDVVGADQKKLLSVRRDLEKP